MQLLAARIYSVLSTCTVLLFHLSNVILNVLKQLSKINWYKVMKQICNYFCFGSVPNQLIFLAPEKSLSFFLSPTMTVEKCLPFKKSFIRFKNINNKPKRKHNEKGMLSMLY